MANVRARLLRKAGWNLVDQALSALSNIVLSVAVARSVTAAEFGAFSIAFVVFGVLIAVTRSLVGQPLQMRFSGAQLPQQREAASSGLGATLLLGVAGGAVLVLVSAVAGPSLRAALLALAVILPALLVQDSCRMVLLSRGAARGAAGVDAVWALVMVGLLLGLTVLDRTTVFWLMLAWGAGALVSAAVALLLLRTVPVLRQSVRWARAHWDLTRYLFPEYFLGLGAMQLAILLVGALATAESVGALRAAQVLLGPLGILGAGIFQFAVPEVARRQHLPSRPLALFAAGVSAFLGLVTVVYLVALLVLPDPWGAALFGDSWPGAATVLLAMGLSSLSSSLANGPAGVLYGIQRAKCTFQIHLVKGPVLLIAVLVGTASAGAVGAAWGLAAAEAAVLPAWVLTLRHALRGRAAPLPGPANPSSEDVSPAPLLSLPAKRATS